MQFDTCAHGNIAMTCPQCKGRAVVGRRAPAAAAPRSQGFSSAHSLIPQHEEGMDELDVLYARTKDPHIRFNIMMAKLGEDVVERNAKQQLAAADAAARQHAAFWRQINEPTTVFEHESQHGSNA